MRGYVLVAFLFALYACDRNANQTPAPRVGAAPQNEGESQKGRIGPSMPGSPESTSSRPEDRPSAPQR
jgi:hypothetical protein